MDSLLFLSALAVGCGVLALLCVFGQVIDRAVRKRHSGLIDEEEE